MKNPEAEFIAAILGGHNTGGNIMTDLMTLKDGSILAVYQDVVVLHKDIDCYYDGEEIGSIERPELQIIKESTYAEFVESITTENTGGGIMVDFVNLKDGSIIGVSDELVCLYVSMEAFDEGVGVDFGIERP